MKDVDIAATAFDIAERQKDMNGPRRGGVEQHMYKEKPSIILSPYFDHP